MHAILSRTQPLGCQDSLDARLTEGGPCLSMCQVTMPACLMTDGQSDNLFDKFSVTAQKIGVCKLSRPYLSRKPWAQHPSYPVQSIVRTRPHPLCPLLIGSADTAVDYANIMEHLVQIWDIEHMSGLSGQAVRAHVFLHVYSHPDTSTCRSPSMFPFHSHLSVNAVCLPSGHVPGEALQAPRPLPAPG